MAGGWLHADDAAKCMFNLATLFSYKDVTFARSPSLLPHPFLLRHLFSSRKPTQQASSYFASFHSFFLGRQVTLPALSDLSTTFDPTYLPANPFKMKTTSFSLAAMVATASLCAALPAQQLKRFSDPLRITQHFTITSAVDSNIKPTNLLAGLHDQAAVARLSPYVFAVEGPVAATAADTAAAQAYAAARPGTKFPSRPARESGGADAAWNTWAIKETVPLYGEVDFHGSFQSMADGLDTVVLAPAGLEFVTQWRLLANADGSTTLSEDFNVTCDALLMPFITANIRNAHSSIQKTLLAEVANGTLGATS